MENILIGKGDGILFKPLALIITFLFFWQSAYALEKSDIEDIGTLIKKHQIEKLSNKEEKYHAYSVLGGSLNFMVLLRKPLILCLRRPIFLKFIQTFYLQCIATTLKMQRPLFIPITKQKLLIHSLN